MEKDSVHSNRLPGLKHGELRSSKIARQWKNPLKLGESPPPTVLVELVGAGLEISPAFDSASKYLLLKKERRQNVTFWP